MTTEQGLNTEDQSSNTDRVRANSSEELNRQFDVQAESCIEQLAGADRETINRHIGDLSREWDMERYLEANASLLSLSGILLGATVNRKFLILPGVVFGFLLQHAVQGWCPPMPVFRRMGIRTRKEINREKFALKALQGDFDVVAGHANRSQETGAEGRSS
jgi:hypothetical protein